MALTKLDTSTLQKLRSWWGNKNPYEPQYIEQEVWDAYAEKEWPLEEFIQILQQKLSEIPAESRSTARFKLREGYEGGGGLKVCFARRKTEPEVQAEIDRALKWLNEGEARDRAEFARLKAKYETVK